MHLKLYRSVHFHLFECLSGIEPPTGLCRWELFFVAMYSNCALPLSLLLHFLTNPSLLLCAWPFLFFFPRLHCTMPVKTKLARPEPFELSLFLQHFPHSIFFFIEIDYVELIISLLFFCT